MNFPHLTTDNVGTEETAKLLLPAPPVLWLPNGQPSKLMLRFAFSTWWYLSPRFRKHAGLHTAVMTTGSYLKAHNDFGILVNDSVSRVNVFKLVFLQTPEHLYNKDTIYISYRVIKGQTVGYALVSDTMYDKYNPQPLKHYSSQWFAELAGTPEEEETVTQLANKYDYNLLA